MRRALGIFGAVSVVVIPLHYERNALFNKPVSFTVAKESWVELPDSQCIWHRLGPSKNWGNRKFVSRDGHYEAVFNSDGTPLKDPLNEESYNFFSASVGYGLPHGIFDVLPYLAFGNTPRDLLTGDRFAASAAYVFRGYYPHTRRESSSVGSKPTAFKSSNFGRYRPGLKQP